ncbi:MAG: acyltransferase [Burkholderiales bacterium]|nr:acyltransferase [Burkholderiales bacterium]MBH2017144.1 acyltransferase [Burkholderiales bacterium]
MKRPLHLPSLDTVRGLAILLVIAHNAQMLAAPGMGGLTAAAEYVLNLGWIGVQLFFVLSGFLITGILMDHLGAPGALKNFFVRRALRIFPLYYGTLFVLFVLLPGLDLQPAIYQQDQGNQTWLWAYLSDWTSPLGMGPHSLPHFWSLAVEEQFYLLWPLLIHLLKQPRQIMLACVAVAVISLGIRIGLLFTELPQEVLYEWPVCRMDALALGGLGAAAWRHPPAAAWIDRHARQILLATGVMFAAAFWWTHGLPRQGARGVTVGYSALALFFTVMVYAAARRDATVAPSGGPRHPTHSLNRLMQSVGKYSYGMYVFHKPLHDLLSVKLMTKLKLYPVHGIGVACLHVGAVVLASYAAAWLSYHLYEVHFLRLKERFA